jgi:hypothetical protein
MIPDKFKSCIEACHKCADECKQCSNACLNDKDVKDLIHCIRLNSDCATVCTMTAKLLASDTPYYRELTELCEKICRDCAKACEKHSHLSHCIDCAKACLRCAEECATFSEEFVF